VAQGVSSCSHVANRVALLDFFGEVSAMVFIVFVGSSPRAIAASIGICLASMLLNGSQMLDRTSLLWLTFALIVVCAAGAALIGVSLYGLRLLGWTDQRRDGRAWWSLVASWFGDALEQLVVWLWMQLAQGPPGAGNQRAPRERATLVEVQCLPTEAFVSEAELKGWTVAKLKDELRRLKRLADVKMIYSGGSSTNEMWTHLLSGVAVEKAELVRAVLTARGGNSGISCAVCLGNYESGALLRLLPCGHRFHHECVDHWLIKQSRTCPLCSKRV